MAKDRQNPFTALHEGGFTPFGSKNDAPTPTAASPSSRPPVSAKSGEPVRHSKRVATSLSIRVLRTVVAAGTLTAAIFSVYAWLWLHELGVFDVSPGQLDAIVKTRPADNTLVYDRDGKKIGEFFDSYHVFVPFKRLPKHLVDAIIAIEDRTYWTHKGFDPKGIARAATVHLKGTGSKQGASTLTQQIVRNFLLPSERTPQRKVQELAFAVQLEKRMTKQRLLEIYANTLFLGNGAYGVGAAAYRYFGKSVEELKPQESALIAGLFQSPSRYNPTRYPKRAKARQGQVLRAMNASGMIDLARTKELLKAKIEYKEYKPLNTEFAPYFVDYVRDQANQLLADKGFAVEGQGLRIYTTIDVALQRLAEASVAESGLLLDQAEERTQRLRTKDGKVVPATLETAILTTDPKTGEILAMVGGRDYKKTKYNRTWQAMRSPGSSFKPVVYSLALQKKWKWSDVIFVSPITITGGYRPHTPDEDYLSETTLLRAFYRSMNTPTIELGEKLGLNPVIAQAKALGIRTPIKEEFGTMLGSSDTTMMDLARMYGAFANEGKIVEQTAIARITDRAGKVLWEAPPVTERTTAAISPQIAFLMTQAMRAVLAMGTGYTSARLSGVAAGKTGTSNDAADNWFCGYSSNLVSIVWVGTDEHASIHGDTTGGKLALPIWDKFMTKALQVRRPAPFRAPSGIVQATIHPKFGNRSPDGVRMFFLRGNEPPEGGSELDVLSQSEDGFRDVFSH